MVKFNKKMAMALVAASMLASPSVAQDKKGTNLGDKEVPATESSKAVDTLALGYRLADYARTAKDARAMIVAAKMVDSVTVKEGTDKGKIEGTGKGTGTAKVTTAADLFAEAKTLAAGDADIVAAVEEAQAEASRGVVGGAIRTVQYVPGNTVWTVRFAARGGEPLVVGVRRDSATPVGLKIFDENGNLVCQDMSGNVTLYCRVNPIWTGPFSVQTINYGAYGTGAALVTN
ncbi:MULTISPECIES: hypothetical protein [unclassified Sphingomonas]|uniref:hypothetical protein n=1 Tax=unclassified Sphingomonas TaxID=196159 RepID=UPI002151ECD3|nr:MULTISPECIES: hypothetical protein [unclassified Sphingomonas]MCR5871081.1 hypothetical protein [Sphingomonas sp. J344]UUY00602.1 hypothetical protein LRS08_05835 [Sphingomonas sp. J315]